MKKIIKKYILALLLCIGASPLLLTSCNYLSVEGYINDLLSLDTVFARQTYLERYIGGTVALLPNQADLFGDSYGPWESAVDEVQLSWQKAGHPGTFLYVDKINQDAANSYYNVWKKYYQGIRKCNTIFQRIDECKDLKAIDKRDYLGITHFLRGAFYAYLLELYGPVPIMPDIPLEVDAGVDAMSFERNTYDECVDYICKDFEEAAKFLDSTRPSTLFSRPTKWAAIAFISRVRLTQASPWYNGNTTYSDWKTSNGRNMISQQNDPIKWAKSAIASKQIMDCGLYGLHTVPNDDKTRVAENVSKAPFPDGVGGIDPFHSYSDIFTGEAIALKNPEIIMSRDLPSDSYFKLVAPSVMGGFNGFGITQKLVNAYRTMEGEDYVITTGDYERAGSVPTIATNYDLRSSVAKRYLNMEPRFYATIGFCECLWPGSSLSSSSEAANRTNIVTAYYVNGNCGPRVENPEDYNLTGYTLKKYIHPEDNTAYQSVGKIRTKTFPIFRYAEILLNYVEAINEMQGLPDYTVEVEGVPVTVRYSPDEIMKYFNMIRYRSGLKGITLSEASDQEGVRKWLKRERMVEFACEGRRYHDIRRWGIANEEENMPVQGMDVTKKSDDRAGFYTVVNIDHKYARHFFEDKMYFWPIPRNVLDQNVKLQQNPGWGAWGEW